MRIDEFRSAHVVSTMTRRVPRSALWRGTLLAGLAAAAAWSPGTTRADDQCPIPAPFALVEAQAIYTDKAGSQLDAAGVKRNQQLIQPLRAFASGLEKQVDGDAGGSPEQARQCAATMLQAWASAGALLQQPTSFPAVRERQRFSLGITLAALKLRAQGGTLSSATVSWLHSLETGIVQDFARRKLIDNLEVWSAVNAASLALLDGDRASLRYENDIWEEALRQIGADGYLPSELRRESRALLYHQYYASAVLVLRQMRIALGQAPTKQEDASLQRLLDRVESGLCEPDTMARAAGGHEQEQPPAEQFAIGLVFGHGVVDDRWTRCGKTPQELRDDTLGGRLDRTLEVLDSSHKSSSGR